MSATAGCPPPPPLKTNCRFACQCPPKTRPPPPRAGLCTSFVPGAPPYNLTPQLSKSKAEGRPISKRIPFLLIRQSSGAQVRLHMQGAGNPKPNHKAGLKGLKRKVTRKRRPNKNSENQATQTKTEVRNPGPCVKSLAWALFSFEL